MGEAYYFRAYFHISLIHRWDNIVLADHVFDDPAEKGSLAERSEVTVTVDNVEGTGGFAIEILIVPTTMKYWEDSTFGTTTQDAEGYRNIILYRLSEAYLIAAEAYMRAGDVPTGQPYLYAVRARAGVANIPLTEENIIDEHARELGHEGLRYAFLKRLDILYERVIAHCPEVQDVYQPFHVRWPIPLIFVDITKVQQNEGYE